METIAPLILFCYKRLGNLHNCVAALQKNALADKTDLYIFSDGPKNETDGAKVNELRNYIKSIDGFKNIFITESPVNRGLAASIISGVTKVLETHNSAIILEDDLIATPVFLSFMNDALNTYEKEKNVFSISGYSFNLTNDSDNYPYDVYFLNRGWSWGWATWKDRWDDVDWDVKDYNTFVKDSKATKSFAKGGSDLNSMLRRQMTGKMDSWAIRFFYAQFKKRGFTVYPLFSKIYNDGFNSEATHTTGSVRRYLPLLDTENKTNFKFPPFDQYAESLLYQKRFNRKMGIPSRIRSKLETYYAKIFKS